MSLLGNYNIIHKSPGKFMAGAANQVNRASFNNPGASRAMFVGLSSYDSNGMARFNAVPSGYTPGYAWIIPAIGGGMAVFTDYGGEGSISSGNLAGGLNGEAGLSGVGTITNADLALIVSAVATIAGSGTFSADITGKLEASADLAGAGDLTGALGALASAVCSIIGTGSITDADMRAMANMSCDITPFTELSPENLAAAVWNAVASAYNDAGTMGEKLNDAGSASNPWSDTSTYGVGTKGKLLQDTKETVDKIKTLQLTQL